MNFAGIMLGTAEPLRTESFGWGSANFLTRESDEKLATASRLDPQVRYLLSLDQNWDGYGAPRLNTSTIAELTSDVVPVLADARLPVPVLIPGGDGSIVAEWHANGISLYYELSADHERSFVASIPGRPQIQLSGRDAREALAKWALHVSAGSQVLSLAA